MKDNIPKVTFYGGAGTVTGANFLLEVGPKKILVDCGLFQGFKFCDDLNGESFPYDPASIDYLFITHAHIDHVGRVPKLVKAGFKGAIYSTSETKEISRLMLEDALSLMRREVRHDDELLYNSEDIGKAFSLWQTIEYHQSRQFEGFSVHLKDAGHILGSTMYEFLVEHRKIVFSGDLGNTPTPLLRDTEIVDDAHYMIIESVYGDRNHESSEERREKFKKVLLDNYSRKGTLIIPAFSLERTQVILSELNHMVEHLEVPSMPVFVDSPLAIQITEIYKRTKHFNDNVNNIIKSGDDIFKFPNLSYTFSTRESKSIIKAPDPKIIIAGSGMSSGGRIVEHEVNYLGNPSNTILLIGYQAPGSLGRRIQDGNKQVTIDKNIVRVRAHIESINGYSSHKDSDHLVQFVEHSSKTLKTVFTLMGEPKAALFLAQRLRDEIGVHALYPEQGKSYLLE